MKIAIHHQEGSFSTRWIAYCQKNDINYKIINAYDSNIIQQIEDCDAFMWHHHQANYKDVLFAKQLLYSLQMGGKKVFPDFNTGWHFDDKVGQKYLLESIGAPRVPSHVFYAREDALEWANETTFPKVFKLRGGASSANVKLVKTQKQAVRLVNKAFGKGFSQFDKWEHLKAQYGKYKAGKGNVSDLLRAVKKLFVSTDFAKMHAPETGYVYFQDFIPSNSFDIRIVVVGNKAFAIKRLVRKGDFRASGSGNLIYDKNQIDDRCVSIAFDVNKQINSQSIAYDFIFDQEDNPLIVELSYGFSGTAYEYCEGYWDRELNWHAQTNFDFCGWMVENL